MAIQFSDIVDLINFRSDIHIDVDPIHKDSNWSIYSGHYIGPAGLDKFPFNILYLFSRINIDEIHQAHKAKMTMCAHAPTYVVHAESVSNYGLISELFGTERLLPIHAYLAKFMKLESYLGSLNKLSANTKYYYPPVITPHYGAPKFGTKYPNLLLEYIKQPNPNGSVAVALAEPGQGKTFECEHLVATMLEQNRAAILPYIPIYINSTQWLYLSPTELSSLERTVINAFKIHSAGLDWIDGHEDLFLKITLRAGLFRIIFDGFDEYVLRNQGHINPEEVLRRLNSLAVTTGTSILITARTSFWQDIFGDNDEMNSGNYPLIHRYAISPFDGNQSAEYFKKRFTSDPIKVPGAKKLFASLSSQCPELVGRGFVLNLIADAIELESDGLSTAFDSMSGISPLHWIVDALCQREEARMNLPLNKEEQFRMLQSFAVDLFQESESSSEEILDFAIDVASSNLPAHKRKECKDKLSTHPIIVRNQKQNKMKSWHIKEEQVENFFISDHLIKRCKSNPKQSISSLLQSQKLVGSKHNDLAAMTVELMAAKNPMVGDHLAVGPELRGIVQHVLAGARTASGYSHAGVNFALTIARRGIERLLRPKSRLERGIFMKVILGNESNELDGIVFSGAVANIDFTDTAFKNCTFENVNWIKCRFSETSRFLTCKFYGGTIDDESAAGLGNASWDKFSYFDRDAERWNRNVRTKAGKSKYVRTDLTHDLSSLVKKFQGRAGLGLVSVEADLLGRGTVSSSLYRSEIVTAFSSYILEKHTISGSSSGGYHVQSTARDAVMFFLSNNQFTGPLKECFDHLIEKLRL